MSECLSVRLSAGRSIDCECMASPSAGWLVCGGRSLPRLLGGRCFWSAALIASRSLLGREWRRRERQEVSVVRSQKHSCRLTKTWQSLCSPWDASQQQRWFGVVESCGWVLNECLPLPCSQHRAGVGTKARRVHRFIFPSPGSLLHLIFHKPKNLWHFFCVCARVCCHCSCRNCHLTVPSNNQL